MPLESDTSHDESLVQHVVRLKDRLLTSKQVAEVLGMSLSQVYELKESGDLEAHAFRASTPRARRGKIVMEEPLVDACCMCGRGYPMVRRRTALSVMPAVRQKDSNLRFTKRSILLYVMRSATYQLSAEDMVIGIACIMRDLPNDALKAIAANACELAKRRGL
jgi:hypothetical protein